MKPLYSVQINSDFGEKELAIYSCDVRDFDEKIDILTASAYIGSYAPTPRTLFEALWEEGVSVAELATHPMLDLRKPCNVWLSDEVPEGRVNARRIGCVELTVYAMAYSAEEAEQAMLHSIKSYFAMLDIAAIYDVKMDTVALPLLGCGSQRISAELMTVPLLNECISFLKRNPLVKKMEKKGVRRGLSAALIYFAIIIFVFLLPFLQ